MGELTLAAPGRRSRGARATLSASLFLAACAALWLTSIHSYLLFHSLVEMISISIAAAVFMISWSSRGHPEAQPFVILGIGYLFASGLDLLHTLAYQGMPVLPAGHDYATRLWVAARGLQALVTLVFVLQLRANRTLPSLIPFLAVAAVTALLLLSIFVWDIFPIGLQEGVGVTPFKKVSEYAISAILLASILLLVDRGKEMSSRPERVLLIAAFATNIASELVFTLYISAYGYQNMIGHLLKLGSFLLAYQALFSTKIRSRLSLIDELKRSSARLQKSEADLRAANLSKDKFFSIIAHDLRNPISGILSLSELLATRFDGLDQRRIRELCGMVYDGARQSAELLECILQWARAHTGRLEVNPAVIPVAEVCEGIAALQRVTAAQKGVVVESRVRPGASVWADEHMVATVIRNLLSNGVKFTPRGGKVVVSSASDGAWERITVSDTGRGMGPQDLEKLFRIDVHFSCPGTDAERGTGMGLILCKELVALNRGRIDVKSEPGKGSTFTLLLPRERAAAGRPL
jgi:signal transduction histidine kinase